MARAAAGIGRQAGGALLAAALLAPALAGADTVVLTNGATYEGVETERLADSVRVIMPIGTLSFPLHRVRSINEQPSKFGEFRAREDDLLRQNAAVEQWLQLAEWARSERYDAGFEKAALRASRLSPDHPDLQRTMRSLGYVFDDDSAQWLTESEAMRRRGFVQDDGDWVSPRELEARERKSREEAEIAAAERRDAHLDKALDIIEKQVDKDDGVVVVERPRTVGRVAGFYPGFYRGLPVFSPAGVRAANASSPFPFSLSGQAYQGFAAIDGSTTIDILIKRQPGSMIPATKQFFP